MRILILGAYGLIGLALANHLHRSGHHVVGLGRQARKGRRLFPSIPWVSLDIANALHEEDWLPHLDQMDMVINAAGVLQDGGKDKVTATQRDGIIALIKACETKGISHFVQISAPGATADSKLPFLKSKAAADAALKASPLKWTIFRPGLVLSPNAYGGTTLLRMLSSFPFIQPITASEARIQTVHIDDVCDAITKATQADFPGGDYPLVEETSHRLEDIILQMRLWLGIPKPHFVLKLPLFFGQSLSTFADMAGHLGWRSALRSTSLKVLSDGVRADPAPWRKVQGHSLRSYEESLETLPSTVQERVFAKTQLLLPCLILTLALFWITSGVIGLWQYQDAMAVLTTQPTFFAFAAVLGGSLIDIIIGIGILCRRWVRLACGAAIIVSIAYLIGGSFLAPHLWLHPLGPLVKIFPSIALAITVMMITEER
ncbi:MAG: SDR family oxidoreductase [Pseudomonadota bacterium]